MRLDSKGARGDPMDAYDGQPDHCLDCGVELGAGYLCDDCDTVEGWE